MGGEKALAKGRENGKLNARERLDLLFDPGSFREVDMFVTHRCTNFGMESKEIPADGVITGHGKVDGRIVFAYAQDFTARAGSLGEMQAKKICKVMDMAMKVGCPVIGFNVRANASARNSANQKGVEIRYYSVIYDLVDDVKKAASGLLSAEVREKFIGYAAIKEVFKVSNVGKVAGCLVTEGVARRSAGVRLLRDDVVIHEGTLKTLKRFKDEVAEVISGQECGMAFENYDDIRPGDVIEIFEREEIERSL
mgnify:CR=1 FL=1